MSSPIAQQALAAGNRFAKLDTEREDKKNIQDTLDQFNDPNNPTGFNEAVNNILSRVSPERQKGIIDQLNARQQQEQQQNLKQEQQQQQNTVLQGRKDFFRNQGLDENLAFEADSVRAQALKSKGEGPSIGKDQEEFQKLRGKKTAEFVSNNFDYLTISDELDQTFSDLSNAVEGNISGPGLMGLAKSNPYTAILVGGLTTDETAIQVANKRLLKETKGLFGSRPTEREIFLLLEQMMPSITKTKESNRISIEMMQKMHEINKTRAQLTNDITKGGTVFISNVESVVFEQMAKELQQFKSQLQQGKSIQDDSNKNSNENKNSIKNNSNSSDKLGGILGV